MTSKDLKNALLQEAVQGKLVPQIASEGNARDLLEEIRKEKAKLVKEGKLKKEKPLPEITDEEISFDIPENWCWCRLGEIVEKLTDGSHNPPPAKTSGYPVISAMNIKNGKITLDNVNRYTDQAGFDKENPRTNISCGDIILGIIGGSIGNIAIYDITEKVIAQRSIAIINTVISNIFISLLLQSPYIQAQLQDSKGTAQGGVYLGSLRNLLIPLPPLTEQKRIVAAIEKFMPLIEEYGKKETELKVFNEQIGTLTKKAILQEAVQGKLVPQIAAEGNAKDLLAEIKEEKAKLVKEGKIKNEKLLPEITEDEIPFDIPESWYWCRLGELSTLVTKGTTPRGGNVAYTNEGIGFLRAENVAGIKDLDLSNLKFIDEDTHQNFLKRSIINENDLLITIAGTLGRTAIVRKDNLPLNANQAISIVRLVNYEIIDLNYLVFSINSPELQKKLIGQTKVTAIPNLTLEIIENCIIPLPPLAEQKRIVTAIEQLLPLCEKIGE